MLEALAERIDGLRPGHPVRVGIDGPRAKRYARGPDDPEGYYRDSYDVEALWRVLLAPLGPGGSRQVRTAVFDWRTDSAVRAPEQRVPDDGVLLFDGIFTQRPELAPAWDLTVFLQISFEESLRRQLGRDRPADPEAFRARFWTRYVGGQQRYLAEVDPADRADVLVDHDDPLRPNVLRD